MAFVVATLIILLQFKQIQSQYYEQQITTPFLIQSQYDPNCYLSIGNATSSNDHDLSGNEKNVFFDCDKGGHYWLYRNGSFWRCSNCVGWFIYSAYTDYWVGQLQWDWSQGEGYNINLNQYNIKLDLTHSKFDPKHGFFISQSLDTIYIYNDQDYNPGRYCPLSHKMGTKDLYNKYISSSQTILVSGYEARADCDLNATSLNIDISFTHEPTADPSQSPSSNPSIQPSLSPSMYPSTAAPSIHPTTNPSGYPSFSPSIQPSLSPSSYVSTDAPSLELTQSTQQSPSPSTNLPSAAPFTVPTNNPLPIANTTGMSQAGLIISKFVTSSKPTTNPTVFPLQTLIITIKGEDADNPPLIDLSSISKGEIIIGIIIIICCCISPLICASVCFYVYRKHHNNVVKMQNDGREQTETSITIEPRVDAIPFKHDECSKCALSIQDSLKILPALNDNYSLSTNGLISSAVIDLKQNITPIDDEKEVVVKCMVNKTAGLVMSDDKSKANSIVSSVHTLNIEGLEKNKILPKYINNESGKSGMSDDSVGTIQMTTRMKTRDLNANRVLKLDKNILSDVTDISDGMYEVCGHSMEMRQTTTTNDHTGNIKSRKHSGSV